MTPYRRYAVYHLPEGALGAFGAGWLGRNVRRGEECARLDVEGLAAATARPRRYGFHATLKPPFALASGCTENSLRAAFQALAEALTPAEVRGLHAARLGRFLALVPRGDTHAIDRLAFACVSALDRFRAPPDAREVARRMSPGLSHRQRAMIARWGYPHVADDFLFHLTLTDKLSKPELLRVEAALSRHLPQVPDPYIVDRIALLGEDGQGVFHLVDEVSLSAACPAPVGSER